MRVTSGLCCRKNDPLPGARAADAPFDCVEGRRAALVRARHLDEFDGRPFGLSPSATAEQKGAGEREEESLTKEFHPQAAEALRCLLPTH